jgi:hypothetical protein
MTGMTDDRRLFVHVGLPKTGTTYLQSILFGSQEQLAADGLAMVPDTRGAAFQVMLETRGRFEGQERSRSSALAQLDQELRRSPSPNALLTEESLSRAKRRHIAGLIDRTADREVHLVVNYRDIARQVPSAWQQHVKAGGSTRFGEYVARTRDSGPGSGVLFWRSQDIVAVLQRWAKFVPPERTHVVVVGYGPQTDLLQSFCSVLEVDAGRLDPGLARPNASIGFAQTEMLASVIGRLSPEALTRDAWGAVGKRQFAERQLARQGGSPARLGREHEEWCASVANDVRELLVTSRYHVVGDLDDVMPHPDSFADTTTAATADELLDAALDGVAALLEKSARRHRRELREDQRSAGPSSAESPRSSRSLLGRWGRKPSM